MNYINTENNQYPVTESQIRAENPNTSFPTPFVAPEKYAVVFQSPQPAHNPMTHAVREIAPAVSIKGQWEQRWEVYDLPQDQIDQKIAAARSARWEQVKAERKRRTEGGVMVNTHWFQTDPDSRIQFLRLDQKAAAALAAGGQPTDMLTVVGQDIYWKTYDNGLVPMTVALAQGIAAAIEVLDAMAFARGEQLRAQIEASTDPESIDIINGWPPIYEA